MMHTKDILADELRKVGLTEMADRAAQGYYHDYLSPLAAPSITLANDLAEAARKSQDGGFSAIDIIALRQRHLNGDFDASPEESDDWAESPEGQAAFQSLIGKGR
jgi:hypothetical protein